MSGLDVEALLEEGNVKKESRKGGNGSETDRRSKKNGDDHDTGSARGSHDGDRRRRSHGEDERHRSHRDGQHRTDSHRARGHSRSRSPTGSRYYRPDARDDKFRERDRERDRGRDHGRDREGGRERDRGGRPADAGRPRSRSRGKAEPQLTEDERDRRTIFVQQLAARLRTKELMRFFHEKAGPVQEAQIVKDRVSGRSKGVGYVEFKDEESVAKAINLTGHALAGIPIIAQLTEAEKNRQVKTAEGADGNTNSVPFHRLYVGNVHFSVTEDDLENVFGPFGELEFVQLQKEEGGRSRGYGFVQFRDPAAAKAALESMNGFQLAARPIRVGLGNDRFTAESTASMLQRFPTQGQGAFQGSAFSGSGGRGAQAGGGGGTFDRAGGRDNDKAGGASALDDTDVAGVNYNNYSRDSLMRKLARTDETSEADGNKQRQAAKAKAAAKQQQVQPTMASRCIILKNMFDPSQEEGDGWVKELEDDVRHECDDKYGHVVHISVDPNTQGDIYLKFDGVKGGENAIKGLNGRYFGGRQISAQPLVDAVYNSLFSKAA